MEEILQHVKIRLCAKRGVFYPDMGFGSYLYRLKGRAGEKYDRLAMEYVQQALDGMPNLLPEQVEWDGKTARVILWVQGRQREVTVTI